jgi:hypothetical protein
MFWYCQRLHPLIPHQCLSVSSYPEHGKERISSFCKPPQRFARSSDKDLVRSASVGLRLYISLDYFNKTSLSHSHDFSNTTLSGRTWVNCQRLWRKFSHNNDRSIFHSIFRVARSGSLRPRDGNSGPRTCFRWRNHWLPVRNLRLYHGRNDRRATS